MRYAICALACVLSVVSCGSVESLDVRGDSSLPPDGSGMAGNGETSQDSTGMAGQGGTGGHVDASADNEMADTRSQVACVWDPYPWSVMPCPDGVTAVCCYTRPDGSCDGRREGCAAEGKECVLTCN